MRRLVRVVLLPLLAVLVLAALSTEPAAWSADEEEEEVALASDTDYVSVSSMVDREEMSAAIRLLSETYQSRVTGYPDAGLVLTPAPTPELRAFLALARAYHGRLRETAVEIWDNLQTDPKRLPSAKEVQERYGQLPALRSIIADLSSALQSYRRRHPLAGQRGRQTAEQRLVLTTLAGSFADLGETVAATDRALRKCDQAKNADLNARRAALKTAKKAVAKLDEFIDVPGDRFDSLSRYVSSFEQLSLDDLAMLHAAGKLGAAGYVYMQFKTLGLDDVDIEPFDVVVPINAGAKDDGELDGQLVIEDSGKTYTIYPMWPNLVRTPKTPPNGIVGRLTYAGKSELRSYNGLDLTNAIVMLDFDTGSRWFNAPLLGGRAVLFIEPERTLRGEAENKFLSIPVDLPRFWVPRNVADHLLALLKSRDDVRIRLKSDVVWETRPAYNIIGRLAGTDQRLKKQQVVLQSYYDSISITPSHAPGAESAANTAALLQVADTFAHHRPKRSVLFLATGGHFQGLSGTKHFISRRKRGARADENVRRLFELAYDSRRELEEAADRVWEEKRTRKAEEEKSDAERAEEQIKALGRVAKALGTVDKNLGKYRKTLAAALEEDPNKKRPEEKQFSDDELAERSRLLEEVFEPRAQAISDCMDALEREVDRAEGMVPGGGLLAWLGLGGGGDAEGEGGTTAERMAQLERTKRAVDALGDALDFSEEGISLWFSVDLSSHNGTFGIFYKGNFYNYSENIQWKFSDIGKKAREYGALIGRALAVDPGKALVDGINAIQGKDWRVYLGGKLALDSEVATLAAIPGLAFATIDDQRHLVDTPLDVWEGVDVANVHRQVRFLACLLHDLVSIAKPKDLYRLDLDDNYCEVYGQLVEFDPKTSYFPDEPIPGSVAVARANFKTAMGVRCEVMDQVGDDGKLSLLGLPNTRAVRGTVRVEGYLLDPLDGHVSYAPDLGRTGDKTYPIEIPMDMMEKPVTVVMFECLGMTIFDMVDQRFFTFLSQMHVYDAASEAEPQEYGTCLPLPPQQWVSYYEPVAVVYARPGTRLKVTMGASVLGLRFVLLNSTDANWREGLQHAKECRRAAEGRGYLVDDYPSIPATPYRAAWDMWKVDDHRAGVLEDKGIRNSRINSLHDTAEYYLNEADKSLQRKEYDQFLVNARRAWSYESRAYPD
ncbi:MAG: M28 family peptidase, partial [Armatimonadota bacterium]